jgi:iron complex transport system permease protein
MAIERTDKARFWTAIALSTAIALIVLVLAPLVGSAKLDLGRALAGQSPEYEVLMELRLSRVLLAMLAGGSLSLAGALFQALLRDALATPYTLGVSSGASLGAVAVICFGWRQAGQISAIWTGALCGAGLVLILVLSIAGQGKRMSSFTLLLAGVAINSMCLALIQFVHSFAGFAQSFSISRWLMGGIDPVEYSTLAWLSVIVAIACAVVFRLGAEWNLLAVGEEWAAARGASTRKLLLTGFIAGSVLTGPVTALTGPIGFVGLIVPHALRLTIGADHRTLMPCSFLVGAAFLAICDALARVILAPADIPVGIVTAILGGPFFIWLLRSRQRSTWL